MPCGRAGARGLAALLVLLVMTVALPAAHAAETFYLLSTTITVGKSGGKLGYDESDSLGSISTAAEFGYPPWNPPPEWNFDRDSWTHDLTDLYIETLAGGNKALTLGIGVPSATAEFSSPTLCVDIGASNCFPFSSGTCNTGNGFCQWFSGVDMNWQEGDTVYVVLTYERELPSAPRNVSVTAPQGEDGTLEVSWNAPVKGGTHPTTHYHVEFRPVDRRRVKRSYVPSSKTSVRRTDLETGTEYRIRVQALGGDGYGHWSDPKTVTTNAPRNPQALPGMTQEPLEPLTMRLKGIPNEHDGENHPFVLRIVFSEPVTATEQEMRDHAIEVRGGAVTDARTVGEEDNVWEIEVTPGSDAELSIAVPRVFGCEEEGALCTSDGRELSNGMGVIVAGPSPLPLTAWFEKVPSGHDGERRFKLRVAFSEGISIGYRTFRDHSVAVKGGRVTGAKRVNKRRDLWEVTVEPDSYGDVTVTLVPGRECGTTGAVCTGDGRELSNGIERVIQGPGESD